MLVRQGYFVCVLAALAAAQSISISGTVTDVNAGVIPDATVTLTSAAAAGRRNTTTDSAGRYSFADVGAGTYTLVFDRAGFETVSRTGTLAANTGPVQIDAQMPLVGVVTSIEVTDVAGKATGSRLDVPDRYMPIQVSSIPFTLLQQQGVNNMVDALKNASGVQAMRWYGVYEYYTIRGFNQADVMLVDGMRLEGNRFNTQLNNVQSVEVLKGPTSVLYGGGALGGVINVVRKKPQGTKAYDFMYRGGRFNSHQVAGGATGPLGRENLLYRLDASFDHSDGWRDAGGDRLNVSPTLTWLMSPRARVTVHQAFNRDQFDGDGGVSINLTTLPHYRPDWRFSLPQDNVLVEDSQTHVLFNANLSPSWEFRNGFLMRRTSDAYFVTEGIYGSPSENLVYREPLDFHHTRRPVQNQADVVGRVKFLGMQHTVLGGYEYQDFYTRTDVTAGDDPDCTCGYWYLTIAPMDLTTLEETQTPLDITTVFRKTYQANRIHAGFWQDQIDILPNLKINIAGRFDDYDRRVHRIFVANPNDRVGVQSRSQTAYTWRAGIVYSPVESHQIYFNSATSFSPVLTVPANQAELDPQYGRTYEIGHRFQGWNDKVQTSLAVYLIERDNERVQVSQIAVQQVGQRESKGVDFDLNADLGRGIRLIGNYGYSQGRIEDPGSSLDRRVPRYVPKHTANIWLRKDWRAGWNASLGMRYLGPQFANDSNSVRIGGYTVFSGAMGYRAERLWEWQLNAGNLFNRERYFIPGHFNNIVFPGQPINVSTTLRLRFN